MINLTLAAADMEHAIATWIPQQPGESRLSYGERIVLWVIREGITAPLTDEDLELARHTISRMRPTVPLGSPQDRALTDADTLCSTILRGRQVEQRFGSLVTGTPVPTSTPPTRHDDEGGSKVPTTPIRPVSPPPTRVQIPDFSF